VNYLPDSVASIGNSAFAFCGAKQDLFLRGFSGSTGRGIFYSCGIKSITFGPGFKGIGDTSNKMASFQGCSSITNVVFDPAGSGISLAANAFQCKPTLKQPLVLYGVTSVASSAFSNWKIPSITFADGIQSIGTLSGVTTLTNVCFLGAPPSSQIGTWADYSQGTAWVPTSVPYEFRQQWWSYAEGYSPDLSDAQKEELIKETGTTFSSTYATTPSKRPLLLTGVPSNPDPDPEPDPNPGQLRLVAPEDGAVYDTIPWQVRTFFDNPELRSEYPDDDIIAAQDTDGNHYVLNAWMTNLLAQASATGSGSPFKWSCEGGTLCDIAVEYSEDAAFTSPIVERYVSDGATATRPRFLKTGTAYWWRVRGTLNGEAVVSDVRRFTTRVDAPRLIGVPAFNCRDFGGGTNADGVVVRQGLVIRGKCPPARVNAEIGENKRVATAEYYREFFRNKLGIRTDLDFRSVSEAQEHQQQYGEIETSEIGINHVFYPITPYHLSLAANREPIRDMFRMLAEGTNYPVYCHCAVGSDRTGTFGVLLDGLLGRTDEHIYNNYELPSFDPGLARLRYCRKGSEMFASLEPRQDGHHMRDVVVDYLLRLGLTRDELKAIRRAFLVFDGPDDYIDNFTSPKAVYDSAARRLTFYCDSDDHTGEGLVVYKTNDGNASWYGKAATNAQQVVFDPSFAKFHPAACSQWFQDMSSLTNISGMAYLDTSRATAFQNMFRGCKKLPSIDFSHFDTRKVAGMQSMFYDCAKLTTLDLSSFDTRSLTVTGMMFYNCSALKTIYVGWGFSVAKVKGSNGDNMFRKASKLKGGCGTACDGNNNNGASYAHIDAAGNPGYFTLAPGVGPLDPADVPQPVFSGSGTSAPRLDAQGRVVAAIGNAVAGGRYRVYATTSLSEPFEPVGEAVSATADGVLEFVVETNGAPSLFVTIKAE
jgi:surface protein